MRYFEIASGMRLPVYTEEGELLQRMTEKPVCKSDLDDRQQEVVRLMVSRGLIDQFKKDDKVFYKASSIRNIWRDRDHG